MMSITSAIPAILGVWGTRITRIFIEKTSWHEQRWVGVIFGNMIDL